MVHDTKENMLTERKREKVPFILLTAQFSKVISKATKSMVSEFMNGLTVKSTKVNGLTTKCAAKAL